jgi:hypothetical protein
MGMINAVGSLRYDMYGRKRKTKSLSKPRSSRGTRTPVITGNACSSQARGLPEWRAELLKLKETLPKYESLTTDSGGGGTKVDNSWKIEASKKYTIAPAYNKGAYQVIPNSDLKHIGKK